MFWQENEVLVVLEVSHPVFMLSFHKSVIFNVVLMLKFYIELFVFKEVQRVGPLLPEFLLKDIVCVFFVKIFINVGFWVRILVHGRKNSFLFLFIVCWCDSQHCNHHIL